MTEHKPDTNELLFTRLDNMIPMVAEMFDDTAQHALDNTHFHECVRLAHLNLKCALYLSRMEHAQKAES